MGVVEVELMDVPLLSSKGSSQQHGAVGSPCDGYSSLALACTRAERKLRFFEEFSSIIPARRRKIVDPTFLTHERTSQWISMEPAY